MTIRYFHGEKQRAEPKPRIAARPVDSERGHGAPPRPQATSSGAPPTNRPGGLAIQPEGGARVASTSTQAKQTPPTGGGAGSGSGDGYQAHTAFGRSVLPGMYSEAQANPDELIRLWFQQQHMGTLGGTYGAALQQADNLGLLHLLMSGSKSLGGTPEMLDWTDSYLKNQFTPGAQGPSTQDLITSMFTKDKNNPVYNYISNPDMTPSDQVQNMGSTLNKALEGNMPDIVRAALLARVRALGDDYSASRLTHPGNSPFVSYMGQNGLGPNAFNGGV